MAAALALLCSCKGGKTTVSGKIIGYAGEYTEFFIPSGTPGQFDEFPVEVAENGSFTVTLDMKDDWLDAPFFVDKFMFRVCIEKGKKYNAVFDITEEGREDEFHFEGEGASENEFMRFYFNHFFGMWMFEDQIDKSSFDAYCKSITAQADKCRELLQATGNDKVIAYYEPEIQKLVNTDGYYYPFIALAADGKWEEDEAFAAFKAAGKIEEMSSEDKESLINGVASYAATIDDLPIVEAVKVAGSFFPDQGDNNFFMTSLLKNYLSMGNVEGAKEAYAYYTSLCKEPAYLEQVSGLYEATVSLAPGAEAPDIEMEDTAGNKVMLSSLRGTALYIDFWATWCGPCRAETPHMAKMAEKFAGVKGIKCISISLDEDKSEWEKLLAEEKPAWPHYILTEQGQKDVSEKYKINAIPRFVILDKDGKIVALNAKRPSDGGAAEQIQSAVK